LETATDDLPATSLEGHRNVINAIADGVCIRASGPGSKETMDFAMAAHAAHPSTQHNNERAAKEGALMQSTGKTGKWANTFEIASNGFAGSKNDTEDDSDDDSSCAAEESDNDSSSDEDDNNEDSKDDDVSCDDKGPSRRKQGSSTGPKKIRSFFPAVDDFETQLQQEGSRLGCEIKPRKEHFCNELLKEADAEKEKQAEAAAIEVMSVAGTEQAPSALERIRGEDSPSQLHGCCSHFTLSKTANVAELVKEPHARGLNEFNGTQGVRHGVKRLKADEAKRFERAIANDLARLGNSADGLRSLKEKKTCLKEAIANKEEEECSGERDVDIDTKFKAVADLDVQKLRGVLTAQSP
jgi:hypothetical protein